jgi:hypothetical protein
MIPFHRPFRLGELLGHEFRSGPGGFGDNPAVPAVPASVFVLVRVTMLRGHGGDSVVPMSLHRPEVIEPIPGCDMVGSVLACGCLDQAGPDPDMGSP